MTGTDLLEFFLYFGQNCISLSNTVLSTKTQGESTGSAFEGSQGGGCSVGGGRAGGGPPVQQKSRLALGVKVFLWQES